MSLMPTRADLEAIATSWISLWNVPVEWSLFERLHSQTFEDCASGGRPTTREGFAQGIAELTRAFPDLRTAIDGLVVDEVNSQVAIRWCARGTNRERYLGVGPTNRLTAITGIEIIEVQSGRIVRRWGEWDISAHLETGA